MDNGIPKAESLKTEFKSDSAKQLGYSALATAVACMANADGGNIFVGVEDDGRITGLHSGRVDLESIPARIADRTDPPITVRLRVQLVHGRRVLVIEVPRSPQIVSTSDGRVKRRRIGVDGKPECVRFLPHEFSSRAAQLGQMDISSLPVPGASTGDLLDSERTRLKGFIERLRGDRALLALSSDELDKALRLTVPFEGRRVPTITGLVLIGKEEAIVRHVPAHEVALQHLEGSRVRYNEFRRGPLIRLFEEIEQFYNGRVVEEEFQRGLFRVAAPSVSYTAFRECVVNALVHRDYHRLGAVHIKWLSDTIKVSSPGGFVDGVRLSNLLVTDPVPRNPVLADAFKRIGLAERTGRGIDLIYSGLLRFGRPAPNFEQSSDTSVVVELSAAPADLKFLGFVIDQEERLGHQVPIDALLVLSHLRQTRRTSTGEIAELIQKDALSTRRVLEQLVELGLVQSLGGGRGREYILSSTVYKYLDEPNAYVRQAGFERIQHMQMIMNFVGEHEEIRRRDVVELCGVGEASATRLLKSLVDEGKLRSVGRTKAAYYVAAK